MKYERLTERYRYWELEESWQCSQEPSYEEIELVYNRLAKLEDKIENGTLVELPCKVGDMVYVVYSVEIVEWEVDCICIDKGSILFKLGHKGTFDYNSFWLEELGNYAFLTKDDAEKRLKELRGEA